MSDHNTFKQTIENSYKNKDDEIFSYLSVILTSMDLLKSDERFTRAKLYQIDNTEISLDIIHDRFNEKDNKSLEVYFDKTFIGYVRKWFYKEDIDNTKIVDEFCFNENKLKSIEMYWNGEEFYIKQKIKKTSKIEQKETEQNEVKNEEVPHTKTMDETEENYQEDSVDDLRWAEQLSGWAKENNLEEDVIPKDEEYLNNMTELSLTAKHIIDIPEEIENLVNLKDLWLGYNDIKKLPSAIGKLKNLTQLSLSQNQLRELPRDIINLENLTLIALDGNPLTLTLGQKQWLKMLKENGCVVNIDKDKIDLSRVSVKQINVDKKEPNDNQHPTERKTTNSKKRNDMWTFKKKINLGEEIDRVYEVVSSKIHSERVAKQFILEELDAASLGDDKAKMLVSQSGFSKSEYKNAMKNSFKEVDGPQGPQQALLRECMLFEDKNVMVAVRVSVVEKIINKFRNGSFNNDQVDSSNFDFLSQEEEVISKLLKIKALKGQGEALRLFEIVKDKNGSIENLPTIVATSILQANNLKKLIQGDDHSDIRNTMVFLKKDEIINLLEKLSKNSVTELAVGFIFQDKKYWNIIRETLEEISHPMFLLALDSVADNLYFILIGLVHEKQMNDKDLYEEIFK